jgi:hypothetical protein
MSTTNLRKKAAHLSEIFVAFECIQTTSALSRQAPDKRKEKRIVSLPPHHDLRYFRAMYLNRTSKKPVGRRYAVRKLKPTSTRKNVSISVSIANACRKRPFSSTFPMSVPSLSWQNDRFLCSNELKAFFAPLS